MTYKNMMRRAVWMVLGLFVATGTTVYAAKPDFTAPPPAKILQTLRPVHPRIVIDEKALTRIRQLIRTDQTAAHIFDQMKKDAETILDQPPSKYEKPDGRRLLSVSRRVKERVRVMGLVYLLEGDQKYRDRIWTELETAAKFKDWNPSHFLDTAEMTHAFAMGYDWLYDQWSDSQRQILMDAIVSHGIEPALKVYESGKGWPANSNNWNQVCNGGIGMGALAIADKRPELATKTLDFAIRSLPLSMSHYAPDGAGTEGATYWDYGSRYNILFLSALDTSLGTDFGLSRIKGFDLSGAYQMYMSGADMMAFNFADCGLRRLSAPQHFWMGRMFNRPDFSWFRHAGLRKEPDRGGPLDLIWYDPAGIDFDPTELPLDKYFRGSENVSMRSAWNDPNALVLGIQAGDTSNLRGHRHLDLGTFILEALGERWAIDSGTDHETYMRHINHQQRWAFYRVRAEGHNTLVIDPANGPDQNPKAVAKVIRFSSGADRTDAVVDLTQAYKDKVKRAHRTFSMIGRRYVTVTDDITASRPADLWWFMHTEANVKLDTDGKRAVLQKNGKKLIARIVEPKNAKFTVMAAEPMPTSPNPKPQASNKGRRKLAIHLNNVTDLNLSVRFDPVY